MPLPWAVGLHVMDPPCVHAIIKAHFPQGPAGWSSCGPGAAAFGQATATRMPWGDEASSPKPSKQLLLGELATRPSCSLVSPETLGSPVLFPGSHGLKPQALWLGTILRRCKQTEEKPPVPRATSCGKDTQGWRGDSLASLPLML